ncbi:MAG TPA: M20 family metallopeptidase [Acidimicrobiales bacterium]|nr:M20 family metallopeptidase [Acidimicrobiales bacterium]
MELEDAKARVQEEVDRRAGLLLEVSHRIHGHPELVYAETFAADLLASALGTEAGAYGLDTAFEARTGSGTGPNVAVICEYDALPGIGHACGHNVIAAAGLGAGLAAGALADEAGGRLVVLGTPAEEGGGGKIVMGERGAFDGVDAALMVHPAGADLTEADVIAIATWRVEYFGRGAHAAAAPQFGRNALDAMVLGYNSVAALRQHIASTDRIHGVFTKAGEKPNIVPDHTVAEWYVRSATIDTLQPLKARVLACLEAGAAAAGCRIEVQPTCPEYSDLRTNPVMVDLYRANSEALGRPLADPSATNRLIASTDMGNVSYLVPSIHPMIAVSPPDVPLHSAEFAQWAASEEGDRAVLDGAKAMAMTVMDLWLGDGVAEEVRAAFGSGP